MRDVAEAADLEHAQAGKARRLRSLDALRGLTVVGMILVNASAALSYRGPVFPLLLHAEWAGFTIADTVFPAFIVMVGVSIAVASRPDRPLAKATALARAGRLILLGLLLTNMFKLWSFDAFPWRLPGVLQRIGIVYAATALLYPRTGTRTRALLAGFILLLYWPLCLIPSPDGLPTDLWVPGHNFVSWVDRTLLGAFAGEQGPAGYDPEGVLSTLPAFAECLIGAVAGDLLRRGRAGRPLAAGGAAMIAGGLVWGLAFPIAKKLWTSSFVLVSAGLTLVLLAGFHAWLDRGEAPARRGGLLGSFGRNAITAYALHEAVIFLLGSSALKAPYQWLAPQVGPQVAALAPVALFIALLWCLFASMDRRGWYVKI
jgi:predicted acyltransferase